MRVYSGSHGRTIIFCETKKEANELAMHSAIKQVPDKPFISKLSARMMEDRLVLLFISWFDIYNTFNQLVRLCHSSYMLLELILH